MEIYKFLIAGIIGTTSMTLFSYILSWLRKKDYREPELLNLLIKNYNFLAFEPKRKSVVGWCIHYSIGFLMLFFIILIMEMFNWTISFYASLAMGVIAGMIGVVGWQILFILTHQPPNINIKDFSVHLIFAHILFSITSLGSLGI